MLNLNSHYHLLLGLTSSWQVDDVQLSVKANRVEIQVSYKDDFFSCPECGESSTHYDNAPTRSWRHLDTMQFETVITASVPRCNCKKCGVKTIHAPWASGHSRFTLLFECFAIDVLQNCSTISSACTLLGINWHTADMILKRAVDRGLTRRSAEAIPYIGIDEKSFGRGHNYVTVLTDLIEGRVLEVVEDRTNESTKSLLTSLSQKQQKGVEAVAMDFWKAFISQTELLFPEAVIVHDKFHISKYLNEAVDKVRKWENRLLRKEGDDRLVGTKFHWLQNIENMTDKRKEQFLNLLSVSLKTGEAWALKNTFQEFWSCTSTVEARAFFNYWKVAVEEVKVLPLTKVANMLERHLERILTYFIYPITNGVSEGLNSKIQIAKAAARGFRSFHSYRRRILFFCGKLSMKPEMALH